MYNKILFPTDGSDESAAVLEHAVDLAKRYDATLEGLFVGDQRSYAGMAADMDREQIREAQTEIGEKALDRVRSAGESEGVDVATTQSVGVPADEILEVADEDDVDLVVMGTHGRTGIKRALLGSVAERVVRQSPVPIHLVPVGRSE
jgi:nucleotide-binding universal stress UspA family protein